MARTKNTAGKKGGRKKGGGAAAGKKKGGAVNKKADNSKVEIRLPHVIPCALTFHWQFTI